MNSCELAASVTALACAISECCSQEELPVIAAVFTQLGDTITTILAQNGYCSDLKEKSEETDKLDNNNKKT